jgi:preprotein translocase subunit SecD
MFKKLPARFALIGVLVLASIWAMVSNYRATGSVVTLGLDLQGGTHLGIEVQDVNGTMTRAQRVDATDRALQIIRTRIDQLGVAEPVVQKAGEDRIVVELPGLANQERAKEVIQKTASLKFQIVAQSEQLGAALQRIDRAIVAAGVAAPSAEQPAAAAPAAGLGELLGAAGDTAAEKADSAAVAAAAEPTGAPLSSKLQPGNQPSQFAVADADVPAVERYLEMPEVQALLPRGTEFRWGVDVPNAQGQRPPFRTLYLLEARPIMTGEYLEDATAQRDPQFNRPEVTFQFNRQGGRMFERATGSNIGRLLAIVLDERVYSAPVIQSQIGSSGRIELGNASIEEARDLALVLRAGALPAPIKIVEERTIGPSLGADSVAKGQVAAVIGVLLVVLIMVGYYRLSGLFAVGALIPYVLFVLATLTALGATLTLPGIAALVLSIGMAVDANVLIFERIREELAEGRSPRIAVQEGFHHALSAIIDSHVTTLISSIILFEVGTGPVKGFAVTLAIGMIASLFSAVFVTRTFFILYLERRSPAAQGLSI